MMSVLLLLSIVILSCYPFNVALPPEVPRWSSLPSSLLLTHPGYIKSIFIKSSMTRAIPVNVGACVAAAATSPANAAAGGAMAESKVDPTSSLAPSAAL